MSFGNGRIGVKRALNACKTLAAGLHLHSRCDCSVMEVEKFQKLEVFTSFLLALNVTSFD